MKYKLIIGLLFFSSRLFAGAEQGVGLEESISNLTLVVVAALTALAIYTSLKAYEVVVGSLEENINEEKKIK